MKLNYIEIILQGASHIGEELWHAHKLPPENRVLWWDSVDVLKSSNQIQICIDCTNYAMTPFKHSDSKRHIHKHV